jgi:lipopolysaccharide export system permease protein
LKLHLYILRELIVGLCFTLGGIFALALPAIAAVTVHKLPGVEIDLVLWYVPLVMAGLIPYVVPVAFLLAVVWTYGRLASDNEWTAIRMSGRNPLEMFAPPLVLGTFLGVFTLWMVGEQLPKIRMQQGSYKAMAIARQFRHFAPGRTEIHLGKFYLSAASREGDEFVDAFIYLPSENEDEEAKTLLAERVRIEADEHSVYIWFKDVRSVVGNQDVRLGAPFVKLDLDSFQKAPSGVKGLRYLTSRELRAALTDPDLPPKQRTEFRFEIQYRSALSSTYLIFVLLGAPTALMMRRGTQLGAMAVAVGYALLYYVLSMRLGKILFQSGHISPGIAAWSVIAIGAVAGSYLTWKALRE